MRKKIQRTLFIAAMFASLLVVTAFAENATVSGNDVNFRSGPGMNYSVYDCLPKDTVVTVTDRSNSEWYGISYNGKNGFISSRYLSLHGTEVEIEYDNDTSGESAGETIVVTPADSHETNGYINAMYVRFRSGASTGSSILGEYNNGKRITITGISGEWTAVIIDGVYGYVFSQYVTSDSAVPEDDEGETVVVSPSIPPESSPEVTPTPEPTPVPTPQPTPTPEIIPAPEGQTGYINGDYVRFRSGPSTSDAIIASYNRNKSLTITGTTGEWTAVVIDGTAGYVYSQYVTVNTGSTPETETETEIETEVTPTENTTGYIKGTTVRFRSAPSVSSSILGEYNTGKELTITGTSGEWKAVIIDGVAGYVHSDYITTVAPAVPGTGGSELGREIAQYALQYVGYPYVWGGNGPNAFDCSGFTKYVYSQFGYTLNRIACDQALNGVHVEPSDLQPGDLLCFYSNSSGYIGHVGLYIGNNQFVHASTSTTGVIISELSGYYTSRGYEARRIV